MWANLWQSIGNFFTYIFDFMPIIGNKINYLYVFIIFSFLVICTIQLIKNREKKKS